METIDKNQLIEYVSKKIPWIKSPLMMVLQNFPTTIIINYEDCEYFDMVPVTNYDTWGSESSSAVKMIPSCKKWSDKRLCDTDPDGYCHKGIERFSE